MGDTELLREIFKENVAVHVDSFEKIKEFEKIVNNSGSVISFPPSYYNNWAVHTTRTCFRLAFATYCYKEYYEDKGYKIIHIDELIKQNKTTYGSEY